MINWFTQVISIALYNLRTIPERKGAAITCAVGIAGVVAVLVGVLSIAEGFRKTMTVAGANDIALVLRAGANNEMSSGLSHDETRIISDAAGIARTAQGALASAELFVIINLPKRSTGTDANVPFRGVQQTAFPVRGNVKIVQGRAFEPGRNEIIAGVGAAREFSGLDVGKKLRIGQNEWDVVGIFSADGGIPESEVWTDAAVLQPAYHRGDSYQVVYAKLTSSKAFTEFKDALTTNPQLNVRVTPQTEFYSEQSTMITGFIRGIGVFIASLMAVGALFGALNTMYSAVSARTREIATLRAIGFGASPVILSVLMESLCLALLGGAIGGGAAYLAFNGFTASTLNWQTFSQVSFAFSVSPELLLRAIIWAAVIGLIGGLLPSIRAARLPIASGLRET
jgi:putative ABC transport system permease protein